MVGVGVRAAVAACEGLGLLTRRLQPWPRLVMEVRPGRRGRRYSGVGHLGLYPVPSVGHLYGSAAQPYARYRVQAQPYARLRERPWPLAGGLAVVPVPCTLWPLAGGLVAA